MPNYKKIIVAPDSFKGSLSAEKAADTIAKALRRTFTESEIVKLPIADGGEGSAKVFASKRRGRTVFAAVLDPIGERIVAEYLVLDNGKTAIIEMAEASGLTLIPEEKRNPLHTTTYGTGVLIKNAIERGCGEIIVCIGGSATNDCGCGMAQALGVKFYDSNGEIKSIIKGSDLARITDIWEGKLLPYTKRIKILVACDVENPLLGKNGATYTYGPQKGASPSECDSLEKGMESLIELVENKTGKKVKDTPGAGAAGGLGAGLMAFLNAELRSGIEILLELTNFERELEDADLVITGEGSIDSQSVQGKVLSGILKLALKKNVPVVAFGGQVKDEKKLLDAGLKACYTINPDDLPIPEAMANAEALLFKAVQNANLS